jgi:hypothetical protein
LSDSLRDREKKAEIKKMRSGKRGRQGSPVPLGNVLRPYLHRAGLVPRIRENRLIEAWEQIVGKGVAEATEPARLQDRTLQVKVANSVWMQELQFHKKLMLQKVNEFLGEPLLQDLRFMLGEKARAETKRKERETVPIRELKKEEKEKIERAVGCLSDGEMKEVLSRLFARGLAVQGGREGKK